ncbi:outer membrane protein assembly factor BamC [Saccharophagus sp. K07]|uniref:outer membrane protein assembly factor BamC n=1 Tax=Saccharophagus sp. K07 TaxID=2283636 RepID=UPI001651BC8F|nr:outer membrane protein assembly factor BamC [Saccharophagus sp. K07]MBC6905606.1 outer membrane protein assembly factor BamC [Saccharophagus sp. K07]
MIRKTLNSAFSARIVLLAISLTLPLSGCIFRDRSQEYQRSGSIKEITLPEGVSSVPLEPLYPIPEVREQESTTFYDIRTDGFVVPRPEPISAAGEKARIKIQKVGDRRWILIDAPAAQVWPLTQSFLSRSGIEVAESSPNTGLVVTDWVIFKSDPQIKNQYRIRIEKGLRPESTEIHILQRHADVDAKDVAPWGGKSLNVERESWLLEELANALAGDIDNKAASLLGQSVGGQVKAELFIDGTEPAMRLRLEHSRAWASLAHALTQEGYILWDESADQRVFYAQFLDPAKKRNWFIRLFTFEPKSNAKERRYPLNEILANLAPKEEVRSLFNGVLNVAFSDGLEDAFGYLVVLQREGGDVVVKIRDARGSRINLADNKRMLSILRRNLI